MINRGSEWRRWEMHLHTPGTKKADQYAGQTDEEKWDNFYTAISDYIGDGSDPLKSICAIAVTDYLSIDNYSKVLNDDRIPDCVRFILPNVELRMTPFAADSPINIHCLFDPAIVSELENRFFAKLEFEYDHTPFNATRGELIRLGRAFTGNHAAPEEIAYLTGLNQFVISSNVLSDLFKNDTHLREKTIIVVSNRSNDGASGLRAHSDYLEGDISQLEATRRTIYQLSDMIYSSNPKDIAYFLGEGTDDIQTVKAKCGSLMPCIHGCDAHCNERIFSPADDRFCWIKADPTFEGLKQVLYEPKERVRISSTFPDSKPSYYVIDHVEIAGNDCFSPEPIYMSDKLTCIIGGKSTGKSLLLHNMAMAIDPEQVREKQETARTNVRGIPDLQVFWRDGVSSNERDKQRKIVYVPQTYLNRLSDEEQETTEIDTIIQSIVLQDDACNRAFQQMNRGISSKKQELAKDIVDFLRTVEDRKTVIDECREIGDETAINTEIAKLEAQLKQLSGAFNVTEEEVKSYQTAVEKARSLKEESDSVGREVDALNGIDSVVEEKPLSHATFSIYADQVQEGIKAAKAAADSKWIDYRKRIIKEASRKLLEIRQEIERQNEVIATLKPKMDGNDQVSTISSKIVEEKARLSHLKEKQSQLEVLNRQYEEEMTRLSLCFEEFSGIYAAYADSVNSNFVAQVSDLEFSARKVFREEQLQQKVETILNNKSISRFTKFEIRKIREADLTPENIRAMIESLLGNSSTTLQFKNTFSIESGLRELLTDWFNIDYAVKMDKDKIQDMSPGKKALVLLRLLISLAESKCPILIDQPEDDLDNRSIFDELIGFIREKKVDRQIITVTHNANIVLGGDAELVIVANQNGGNSPNRQYQFEYRGGSIEDNSHVLDENNQPLLGILNQKGMQEHICEILEGGEQAFDLRRHKYHFIRT